MARMAKVIPGTWEVPERFRERVGAQAGRPRAMVHDGHLLLLLHDVPKPSDPTRRSLVFWRSPAGAWKASDTVRGAGREGLTKLVEAHLAASLALDAKLDRAKRAADYFEVLQESSPLLRAARQLHRALQEAREGVNDKELIVLRDVAGEAERTAELVHGDAESGLGFTAAQQAEEQAALQTRIAKSGHRLNLLVALFMPVSALGAMFGMNFKHGLESTAAPWLFWGAIVGAFVVGFVVRAGVARS
jgi:hypothetical protein